METTMETTMMGDDDGDDDDGGRRCEERVQNDLPEPRESATWQNPRVRLERSERSE